MKTIQTLLILLLCTGSAIAQDNSGEIHGTLIDTALNEPISFSAVFVKIGEAKIGGTTNEDGSFIIKPLKSGTYNLYYMNLTAGEVLIKTGINVKPGKICFLKDVNALNDNNLVQVDIEWIEPLIDPEDPSSQGLDAEQISKSASKNDIKTLLTTLDSSIKQDVNGDLSIRGGRVGNVIYMVDGVKTRQPKLPGAAYESVTAYTGGLPAKYGDTTGGVVIVESKSYFDYYRIWKANQ